MTKIGVISDTHIPSRCPNVPDVVKRIFDGVSLILHAGDHTQFSVVEELEAIAPVKAVCGNMDEFRNNAVLPDKLIATVEDVRIGLIHGWGPAHGLEDRVLESFRPGDVSVIVFGHSHLPCNEIRNGVLLFNPGTPTDRRFAVSQSVGLLTVDGTAVSGEIIKV